MADPPAAPPSPRVRKRPSSASGYSSAPQHAEACINGLVTSTEGTSFSTSKGAVQERPDFASLLGQPPTRTGWDQSQDQVRQMTTPEGYERRGEVRSGAEMRPPTRERGLSARTVEARLDELRADEAVRAEFLERVSRIIERRSLHDTSRMASNNSAAALKRTAKKTRDSVQLELHRIYPLDTERKAELVGIFRNGGLEANRVTQALLDSETKAVLTRKANAERRARETRIRELVSSCRRLRHEQLSAAREYNLLKDRKSQARQERARQARRRTVQIKGWLTLLKMHAATAWAAYYLDNIEVEKKRAKAARAITRHIAAVARHRLQERMEAATRVIDAYFVKKIRKWKARRDAEATAVLKRFLTDVQSSSDVRARVKLLAHRVAHAHVQLAKVQRWWKRRRRELAACRVVLCRLWEQEVDRRVGAKVDQIWNSRHESPLQPPTENGHHVHPHPNPTYHPNPDHHAEGGRHGSGLGLGARLWTTGALPGGAEHARHCLLPSSEGGDSGGVGNRSAARHAKEEQARGEKATIRSQVMQDPLINPPADLKVRMCREYLRQMVLRHAGALRDYNEKAKPAADAEATRTKFGEGNGILELSRAGPARQAMQALVTEVTRVHPRPRWRTGAFRWEVAALVDAGVEYILGLRWLWEPQTPSRLEDGTLLTDTMPTPEDLAGRVASRFRYGGNTLAASAHLQDECTAGVGESRYGFASIMYSRCCKVSPENVASPREATAGGAPTWSGGVAGGRSVTRGR